MHERLSLSSPVSVMNEPECVGWRRMNGPVAQGGAGHDGPEALKTQDLLRPATLVKTSHGPGLFSIISEGGERAAQTKNVHFLLFFTGYEINVDVNL